jgi:hypothetical protein
MSPIHITDLPALPACGGSMLTAQQMNNIRGGAGNAMPVEADGGTGAGPSLPWPGFPQLPAYAGMPGFPPVTVPLMPGYTPDRTPGPAESPIVF